MEILKGFEFQLQRFAEGTIDNLADLLAAATTTKKYIHWNAGTDTYEINDTAATPKATVTFTGSTVSGVTLENNTTVISKIIAAGELVPITNSTGGTITLDNATTATSTITFKSGAVFTAAAAAADATTRTLTAVTGQLTATTGTASVNGLGILANGGVGAFNSSKDSEFTLVNGDFTSGKASVMITGATGVAPGTAVDTITTGTETGAVVSGATATGYLTLKSGTFVYNNIKINTTTNKIAISPNTSATVNYEGISFANTDGATGSITAIDAVEVTAGVASRAAQSIVTGITCNSILYKANAAAVAKFDFSNGVTNFSTGEISIAATNGKFDQNGDGTADLTFAGGTATVIGGETLSIKTGTFTAGSVTGAAGANIKVGSTTGGSYLGLCWGRGFQHRKGGCKRRNSNSFQFGNRPDGGSGRD